MKGEGVRRASSEAVGCPRAVLEKELVDGETRVQRLEVEVYVELDAEVSQLKAKFAMMEAEQQRLRSCKVAPCRADG